MKAVILTILLSSTAMAAQKMASTKGQSETQKPNLVEVVCRIKAKEAAAHTFRSCMLDDKTAQIQDMKKTAAKKIQKQKAQQPKKTVEAAPAQPIQPTAKDEIFKDEQTTVDVVHKPEVIEETDKEVDAALEQAQRLKKLKPAMLVDDDTDLPEPTTDQDIE